MDTVFRVRYRASLPDPPRRALFVEDQEGMLYLFSNGTLQMRVNPLTWWPRISAMLQGTPYHFAPVESDRLFSLETLPSFEETTG
jgi:hypothetical protein